MTDLHQPTRLLAALRTIAEALDRRHMRWALVGGLAVSIRAEPRFTRDIDIAVALMDDRAAEALIADLQAGGFALLLSIEQRVLSRLATVRLAPPGEPDEGLSSICFLRPAESSARSVMPRNYSKWCRV